MLVTMRGQWGEFNPWQVQMGQATRPVLEAVGVKCFAVDKAQEVAPTFAGGAFLGTTLAATLLTLGVRSQRPAINPRKNVTSAIVTTQLMAIPR